MRYHLAGADGKAVCCVGKLHPEATSVLPKYTFASMEEKKQCKTCRKILRNEGRISSKFRVHVRNPDTGYAICVVSEDNPLKDKMTLVSAEEFSAAPRGEQCSLCYKRLNPTPREKKYSYIGVRELKKKQKHLPGTSGMRGLCGKLTNNVVTHEEFEQTPPNMQCPKCVAQSQEQAQNHDA